MKISVRNVVKVKNQNHPSGGGQQRSGNRGVRGGGIDICHHQNLGGGSGIGSGKGGLCDHQSQQRDAGGGLNRRRFLPNSKIGGLKPLTGKIRRV